MAAHSSILVWRIPWMEEPGGLLSTGSHRVEHDWSDLACMHACTGEGNGSALQYSCLENPKDREAWWAAIYRVTQSWTRLKQLSSSSNELVTRVGNWYLPRKHTGHSQNHLREGLRCQSIYSLISIPYWLRDVLRGIKFLSCPGYLSLRRRKTPIS